MSRPKVLITDRAWRVITREIDHFVSHPGGETEAIVHPLFGILPSARRLKAPWETLELEDLSYFIVPFAAPPPRKFCDHSAYRAGFRFNNREEREELLKVVNSWSLALCEKYSPALELGYVHSHQFATGWTSPSGVDYGRVLSLWRYLSGTPSLNLNTALEIIICRRGRWSFRGRWKACCFAFDQYQSFANLGEADIVPENDPRVLKLLTRSYPRRKLGLAWEKHQKKLLPQIEAVDEFHFGWRTFRINCGGSRYLFVHLPPSFPRVYDMPYQLFYADTNEWSAMRLWPKRDFTFRFHLLEIYRYIQFQKNRV